MYTVYHTITCILCYFERLLSPRFHSLRILTRDNLDFLFRRDFGRIPTANFMGMTYEPPLINQQVVKHLIE